MTSFLWHDILYIGIYFPENMAKKKTTTVSEKDINKGVADAKKNIVRQEEFKKWAEAKFKEVIDRFLIDFVSLSFKYVDQPQNNRDGKVIFTVNASDKYHQLNINIYPAAFGMWEGGKVKELIDGIIHECAHIHTAKITQLAEDRYSTRSQIFDENENLTEVVAQYIRLLIKKEAPQIYNK